MTPSRHRLPAPALILVLTLAACGGGEAAPPADAAARGAKLYSRSGCAVCHGPGGRGDGAGAAGLSTPPRDFAKPSEFRAERTPKALAQAIKEGSADGAMPPYQYMSDRDREDLAAFVLSLAPPPSP
jgi:high-affinity iron transporter